MTKKKKQSIIRVIIGIVIAILLVVYNYYSEDINNYIETSSGSSQSAQKSSFDLSSIPEFKDVPYVTLNENKPNFEEKYFNKKSFESYSELDSLGRCGVAFANVSKATMPTKKRESIGSVKPTGWQTAKYDFVDGQYLYNRCHLIGYQLTAENANKKNLITGTRYLNVDGMLPFENEVAEYVKKTKNHVLYRVTPIFEGDNLVASGLQMEAESVEDVKKLLENLNMVNINFSENLPLSLMA